MNIDGHPPRLIVVGAGIAGLAAAHRAFELLGEDLDLLVLEEGERAGGVIQTDRVGDFLLEGGPDSMVTDKPAGLALCHRLGLQNDIQPTQERYRRTLIVHDGKLVPMPEAFQLMAPARILPFLRSPVLSWRGKIEALKDLVLPRNGPGPDGDESLASFVRRRLGNEILERIAQPMIGGIYTADPETLSLASTMPRFLEMERTHRSVIRGLAARLRDAPVEQASGPRYGVFVSLRGGIGSLVDALVAHIPAGALRTGCKVTTLERSDRTSRPWCVTLADGRREEADGIILALPAPITAGLVQPLAPGAATRLAQIEYASSAILSFAFDAKAVPHAPEAFGFVVPRIEGRSIIAGSFSSRKFEGRAPVDQLLVRLFVGGTLQSELLERDDRALIDIGRRELRDLLGIEADPLLARVQRWPASMPQYRVGHARHIAAIEAEIEKCPGLALAGNAYHGVGLADCIRDGEHAAERTVDTFLSGARRSA